MANNIEIKKGQLFTEYHLQDRPDRAFAREVLMHTSEDT